MSLTKFLFRFCCCLFCCLICTDLVLCQSRKPPRLLYVFSRLGWPTWTGLASLLKDGIQEGWPTWTGLASLPKDGIQDMSVHELTMVLLIPAVAFWGSSLPMPYGSVSTPWSNWSMTGPASSLVKQISWSIGFKVGWSSHGCELSWPKWIGLLAWSPLVQQSFN